MKSFLSFLYILAAGFLIACSYEFTQPVVTPTSAEQQENVNTADKSHIDVFADVLYQVEVQPYDKEARTAYWLSEYDKGSIDKSLIIDDPDATEQELKKITVDMITDFEATSAGAEYAMLVEMNENKSVVGLEDRGIILSEIALIRDDLFFFSIIGDGDNDFPQMKPQVLIGEIVNETQYFDFYYVTDIEPSKSYGIYSARLNNRSQNAPDMISIKFGESQFEFSYNWDSRNVSFDP